MSDSDDDPGTMAVLRRPSISQAPVNNARKMSSADRPQPHRRPPSIKRANFQQIIHPETGELDKSLESFANRLMNNTLEPQTSSNTVFSAPNMSTNNNNGSSSNLKKFPKAVVVFDFTAQTEKEISISKGEIIEILKATKPDGWWLGRKSTNQKGHFPASFVKMLEDDIPLNPSISELKKNAKARLSLSESVRGKEFFLACKLGDLQTIESYLPQLEQNELNNAYFLDLSELEPDGLNFFTPFEIACYYGQEKVVRYLLLNRNLNPKASRCDKSPLFFAAMSGNANLCTLLVGKKLQSGKPYTAFEEWEYRTPMLKASKTGNLEMCKFLCNILPSIPDDLVASLKTQGNEMTRRQLSMFFQASMTPPAPPVENARLSNSDQGREVINLVPQGRGSNASTLRQGKVSLMNPVEIKSENIQPNPSPPSLSPVSKESPSSSVPQKVQVVHKPAPRPPINESVHIEPLDLSRTPNYIPPPPKSKESNSQRNNHNNSAKKEDFKLEVITLSKETVLGFLLELDLFPKDTLLHYFNSNAVSSPLISKFLMTQLNQPQERQYNIYDNEELVTQLNTHVIGQFHDYMYFSTDPKAFYQWKNAEHKKLQEEWNASSEKRIAKIKRKQQRKIDYQSRVKNLLIQNISSAWDESSMLSRPSNEQLEDFFSILPPKDLANSSVIHQIFLKFRGIAYKHEQQINIIQAVPPLQKSVRRLNRRTRTLIRMHLLQTHVNHQKLFLRNFDKHSTISFFHSSLTYKLANYFLSLKISSNSNIVRRTSYYIQLNTLNDLLHSYISLSTYDSHSNRHILPWGSPLNTIGPLVFIPAPFVTEEYTRFLRNNNKSFTTIEQVSFASYSQKLEQIAEQISSLITFRYCHCLTLLPIEKIPLLAKDAYKRILFNFAKGGKNALEALYDPHFLSHYFPKNSQQYLSFLFSGQCKIDFGEIWSKNTGIVDISFSPPKFYVQDDKNFETNLQLGWRIGSEYEANFLQMKPVMNSKDNQFFTSLDLLLPFYQESLNKF